MVQEPDDLVSSLRAEGEAIQGPQATSGLLRRFAPRNDARSFDELLAKFEALSPEGRRKDIQSAERALRRLAKSNRKKAKSE